MPAAGTLYKTLLVLVVVVDENDSFSAVDVHILPELVQTILKRINCRCIDDMLWQVVPVVDNSAREECSLHCM